MKVAQSSLTLCNPVDYTVLTKLSLVVYFIVHAQSHLTVAGQAPLFQEFSSRNTGVTCHFLLQGIFLTQRSNEEDSLPLSHLGNILFYTQYQQCESHSVMSDSLWPYGLYSPWNSPGQNTGTGSLSLLQGIFPTQRLNPGLPHCRQILYQLSHKGSPRILEWVAYPFSSGSSQPRNRTRVSCIAGWFFTNWAIREALYQQCIYVNPNLPIHLTTLLSPLASMFVLYICVSISAL